MKDNAFKDVDVSTPALVLKCVEDSHIGLGAARSLGRLGVPVYGIGGSLHIPSATSRYFRETFIHELKSSTSEEEIVDFIITVAKKIGKAVPLLTVDTFACIFAKYGHVLKEFFFMPEVDPDMVPNLSNKWEMQLIAEKHGVPTARAVAPKTKPEVEEFSKTARFPLVFKASEWTDIETRPSQRMVIVHNFEELVSQCDVYQQEECPHVLLQEYISGEGTQDWIFNGYFDEHSNCLISFTGKKVRQAPVRTGYASLGECRRNQAIESISRKFLREIGYKGPVDIDFRYDPRDGLYKILDVNARIGASFRLFVGENGLDVVRAMYLDRTGQQVPSDQQVEGRKWFVEDRDFRSSYTYFRENSLSMRDWVTSFAGVQEAAWFALDDPGPFLIQFSHILLKKIKAFTGRAHRLFLFN
ncbi:MAG: hypothetical protein ACP5U1_08265 [Desulfomonilaceae bacterium]